MTQTRGRRTPGDREDEPGIGGQQESERSAEERAEELIDRLGGDLARFVRRVVARTREEAEDVWAEAQELRHDPAGVRETDRLTE